jgi:hypothetical protein
MVTKGYQKGVYDGVTKGIRGNGQVSLSQSRGIWVGVPLQPCVKTQKINGG